MNHCCYKESLLSSPYLTGQVSALQLYIIILLLRLCAILTDCHATLAGTIIISGAINVVFLMCL